MHTVYDQLSAAHHKIGKSVKPHTLFSAAKSFAVFGSFCAPRRPSEARKSSALSQPQAAEQILRTESSKSRVNNLRSKTAGIAATRQQLERLLTLH